MIEHTTISAAGPGVRSRITEFSAAPLPGPMLIGKSRAIMEVRAAIDLVADSCTAVFITGESGTGKDVVARLIHHRSKRARLPFVALNCAALPPDLIENELFGHEPGAFTGAVSRKVGCFELAHCGTLFFDEIAEMNINTQAKLLRVIETRSFRRLGGAGEISVDVRTLAATNREPQTALRLNKLREDLYYRFSVIEISVPPLRERREDIPLMIDAFLAENLAKYGKECLTFSPEALEMLQAYSWPGNIRELKNVIERCVLLARNDVIGPALLSGRITSPDVKVPAITIPVGISLRSAEMKFIRETLCALDENKSAAARVLKMSRGGLLRKLKRDNS